MGSLLSIIREIRTERSDLKQSLRQLKPSLMHRFLLAKLSDSVRSLLKDWSCVLYF